LKFFACQSKGTGEGQGLKKAEHAAALQILNTLEIQFDFQNSSPSQNESPQKSESVLLKSPGAMQKADSPNEPSKAPVNDQVQEKYVFQFIRYFEILIIIF